MMTADELWSLPDGNVRRELVNGELLSPSDTAQEVEDKVDEYLSAGAALVWLVNPRRKTVTAHQSGLQPLVLREADTLDGGNVVPGFQRTVAEIFA